MENGAKKLFFSLVLSALAQIAFADLVNGNFESGGLAGWNAVVNGQANSIQVASGETVTDAGTINPSPTGDYFVFTSQGGPGSSFLYQSFVVQPGVNRIFFDIAIINGASDFYTPDPMFFGYSGVPNQQARFDILVPGAAFDTVDPGDIIVTGFQTQPGDPLTQDWTNYQVDVSAELAPYVGQTVIFRFVQVDNQFYFNLAIDNVNVGETQQAPAPAANIPVPTMSVYGLVLTILGLWFVGSPRVRRWIGRK